MRTIEPSAITAEGLLAAAGFRRAPDDGPFPLDLGSADAGAEPIPAAGGGTGCDDCRVPGGSSPTPSSSIWLALLALGLLRVRRRRG